MIKKLLLTALIAIAVIFASALQAFALLKNEDSLDVWDDDDEYNYEWEVFLWEKERYEQDMRDLED